MKPDLKQFFCFSMIEFNETFTWDDIPNYHDEFIDPAFTSMYEEGASPMHPKICGFHLINQLLLWNFKIW